MLHINPTSHLIKTFNQVAQIWTTCQPTDWFFTSSKAELAAAADTGNSPRAAREGLHAQVLDDCELRASHPLNPCIYLTSCLFMTI